MTTEGPSTPAVAPVAVPPPDKACQEVLSQRGIATHFRNHPLTYISAIFQARERLWSHEDPEGAVVVAVAENRLTSSLLTAKLLSLRDFPEESYKYQPPRGSMRLRAALVSYLQHTFMKGVAIEVNDLTVLAGCGSVLDLLFFGVADPGDAVFIPTPYYPAFDQDLKARDQVHPHPVNFPSPDKPWAPALDEAAAAAAAAGHRPRGVLLTNPNNPTGEVWPRERLEELLQWCCSKGIHLISDEIYANSVFGDTEFISVARIVEASGPDLRAAAAPLVHVVFGLSKDWCASGLRVGCLFSRNIELAGCLDALGYFASVSNLMQEAACELLSDLDFVDSFVAENCKRIASAYDVVTGGLKAAGIPSTPAVAAIFLWADFRAFLPEPTWEAERSLWQSIVTECRVIMTPGQDCHAAEPGFFRICYAAVEREALQVAMSRIQEHLAGKRHSLQNGKA